MPLRQDPLPRTSGILTFLKAPPALPEELREGMIAVAGAPFDLSTTGRIGARFAPRAYRQTSTYYQRHLEGTGVYLEVDERGDIRPEVARGKIRDVGDIAVYPQDWDKTQASLRESMYQIARTGALPVIWGGDHFITYPLVQGFKDAVMERGGGRVGYIRLSGQLDLGGEDPVWGRVWRGGTARRIIDGQIISPENMVWIGTKGYIRAEQWELAQEMGLKVFTLNDVRSEGIDSVARQAAEIAGDGCDSIYLSVDMDVMDGGYVASTSFPSLDGMRNIDVFAAMDVFTRYRIGAMDLCGLNPLVEVAGQGETGQRLGVVIVLRFIYPRIMGRV